MSIPATTKRTDGPNDEPWTMTELLAWVRSVDTTEEAFLGAALAAARELAEDFTGRSLLTQTWVAYWHGFPDVFELPHPPVISITSIKYLDADGNEQTLATSQYRSQLISEVDPFIEPAYGVTWPSTRGISNDVYVTYQAGYGADAENCPAGIRQAIAFQVNQVYEHRDPKHVGLPMQNVFPKGELLTGAQLLLTPYIVRQVV